METAVESDSVAQDGVQIRLLGPMTISRDGITLPMPSSRKVRALIAYLAMAPQAVARTHLCELLWDIPSDPRGELRWCLSKARSVLDEPERRRVEAKGDTVRLDLSHCFVDAREIARFTQAGFDACDTDRLRSLAALFKGDFLEGLEIDRAPGFYGWLTAQRRRFRSTHAALLEHLVGRVSGEEALGYLDTWYRLAPYDLRVHEMLLGALARSGRIREGEEHLEATARLFESEGLDHGPIRVAWRMVRAKAAGASRVQTPASEPAPAESGSVDPGDTTPRRASIAVMPFVDRTGGTGGGPADGLVHDVITRLAKLRSLFVIAQGTVFALHERGVGAEEAGRMLNVDYVVGGTLRRDDTRLTVTVELTETRTARIVWAETYDSRLDDAFAVLEEIGNRIVTSIANEIESIERNRAILRPPTSLNAWEAHHRGLWHMYRFTKEDNEKAQRFFEMAVRLDPTFARAHAGLSFTHWQNAFQNWADPKREMDLAFETAGESLLADDRDPAAHWAMGRAFWLRGNHDESVSELERAVDLSPNFALGHYTLSFVHSQAGDAAAAVKFVDYSRQLSPFDPMLFAMLSARALALVRLGRFEEAADWAVKGTTRPNAHAHVKAIAAFSLALAGRNDEARASIASIRATRPRYGIEDFLRAFRFDADSVALFRTVAARAGLE
jgi:TolB-like protein/DNA-binding SARP family transcriptional activator